MESGDENDFKYNVSDTEISIPDKDGLPDFVKSIEPKYSDDLARPVFNRNTKPNRIFMHRVRQLFKTTLNDWLTFTPATIPAERMKQCIKLLAQKFEVSNEFVYRKIIQRLRNIRRSHLKAKKEKLDKLGTSERAGKRKKRSSEKEKHDPIIPPTHPATQPNDRQQPHTQQQASMEPLEEKTDKNASGQLVLVRAYEVADDVKAMMHRKLLFSVPVKYNDGSVGRGTNCGSCVCVKTNLAGEMVPRAIVNDVKGYVQCILLVCDEGKAGATAELNEGDIVDSSGTSMDTFQQAADSKQESMFVWHQYLRPKIDKDIPRSKATGKKK